MRAEMVRLVRVADPLGVVAEAVTTHDGSRGTSAGRRRGAVPTPRRRRRTAAPWDERPDRHRTSPMRMPTDSEWLGFEPNIADPQSPQNHFSPPPSGGLHMRSFSRPAGDDAEAAWSRVRLRRGRSARSPLAPLAVAIARAEERLGDLVPNRSTVTTAGERELHLRRHRDPAGERSGRSAPWHSTLAIVDRRVVRALAMRIACQSVGIRVIEGVDRILGRDLDLAARAGCPVVQRELERVDAGGARGGQLPCRRSAAEPPLEPAHSAALRQPPDSIFLPEGEIGSQPPPKSCSPAPFVWPGPVSPAYR
jgi:hypothetical protein